jgi:hypothetical protein
MASSTVNLIPDFVLKSMLSFIPSHACCDLTSLRYLTIPHIGFDNLLHQGELIVHKEVAEEVLLIFQELLQYAFPIEKMRLVEEYQADDNASMRDNNSSAFCYREAVAKPGILSKHSLGLAIDINPLYNPYVRQDLILPIEEGKPYQNRSLKLKGMLDSSSLCVQTFTKYGWIWGGSWSDRQDYHHFEKDL